MDHHIRHQYTRSTLKQRLQLIEHLEKVLVSFGSIYHRKNVFPKSKDSESFPYQ